ncbi:MAG: ABC transporter substrate-binding protein [Pseudomonadota bacterium]
MIGRRVALWAAASIALAAHGDDARVRTVYFNAWGGDPAINDYIAWAGERLEQEHGITLRHVKVGDISEAVVRLNAEHAAGRDNGGSMDLLWINGENFAALKNAGLLYGPWAQDVDGAARINWQNPTVRVDGNLATDGYELPWGSVALTFFYDGARIATPPNTPATLLQWIENNPGRFTYVQPPSFVGTAFLKQLLLLLTPAPDVLQSPVAENFDEVTEPIWNWLDRAHPSMWRRGRLFPLSGPAQRELLAVGEIDWSMAYNPSDASRAIENGELPVSIRGLHLRGGALANSHFVAIPYNAGARDSAILAAAFLISPEAQAHKADERIWGDTTVLNLKKLTPEARARFERAEHGAATPPPPASTLSEPHPSWNDALERAWLQRYTR